METKKSSDDNVPTSASRSIKAAYVAGLFSMGQAELLTFVIPLWAIMLGASPAEIGFLVGARSMLTFVLAIHGGALMDRLGTRRVMLFFTALTGTIAAAYPFLPWLIVALFLQMLIGYASNMTWIGAQTIIAQVTSGDPGKIGVFSFYSRMGNVIAPLIMGFLWDHGGPTYAFLGVAVWSVFMFIAVAQVQNPQSRQQVVARVSWRDLLPRLSDYTGSFKLLALPAVAFTLAISFTRHATNAAESSFLIVYLRDIGLSGTMIGTMFSAAEILNGIGSLLSGRFSRRLPMPWLMIFFTASSILLLSLTPLLGGAVLLLTLSHGLRRISEGIVQPLMFSLQARAVPRNIQGGIVGLRVTNNRLASIVTPIVMGLVVEAVGLRNGFFVTGALLLAICLALAITVVRHRLDTIGD